MNTQWIIFDVMGVVFEVGDDTNELLAPFVQDKTGVPYERINERYMAASLGKISSRRFWEDVGLGAVYPDVEREYLDSQLTLDLGFLPVARKLAEHYSLALLSNDVAEWSVYLRKKHQLSCFTSIVVSGQVGYRKPEPRIYELFLEQTGATPNSCVFVDDRQKNLQAAQALGFRTIHFQRLAGDDELYADARITAFSQLENALMTIHNRSTGRNYNVVTTLEA